MSKQLSKYFCILLLFFYFVFAEEILFADALGVSAMPETESVLPPQTPPIIPATKIPSNPERREAYRVFFPIDRFQKVIGNTVYIPMEFLQLLSRNIKVAGTEPLHRWNIERAEYQGSLVRSPLTQDIELSDDFKAAFDINLDTENATIILPALPIFRDHAFWDSKPVQPVWRAADQFSETGTLVFNIENEQKGKHRLEISLVPKPEERDKTRRVTFNIPKVPNTTLRLRTPQDAPPINVTDCFGAVTPNSLALHNLTAEVGLSDKLSFSWSNESGLDDSTSVDVEQFFWLRAKPTQVEIRVFFRYRIEGGKIRQLNLLTDPRWHRSGPFHCEEYPIDQTETYLDSSGTESLAATENEVTRLNFKTPVSGILTISAGFVLRDFSGIGKVRLPQFRAQKARVTKSMLAVSAEPVMELDYPATGLGSGFESGWPGNSAEEHPLAEYDLTKTDTAWMLAIRTKNQLPTAKINQSIRFDDGDSALHCLSAFSAAGEVFLQRFLAPDTFSVESIEVRDAKQSPVDVRVAESILPKKQENQFPSHKEYIVFFKRSVTGNYSILIQGHFATKTEKEFRKIPLITFDQVRAEEQLLNIFRTPAVVAEVTVTGNDWTESETTPAIPKDFQESLPICFYRRKLSETPTPQNPAFLLIANKPVVRGKQITTLTKGVADSWNVIFDVLWDISDGELATLPFHWDERCGSVISVEPAIPFTLKQTDGHSNLVFAQKIPFTGKQHLRINTSLNTSGTSISVPKLLPHLVTAEKVETKNYVILPKYKKDHRDGNRNDDQNEDRFDELILWNFSHLEIVDESVRQMLEEETVTPLRESKSSVTGSLLTVLDGVLTTTATTESVTPPDADSRLFLQSSEGTDDFTATMAHENTESAASLYDIHFFIKDDGVVFGNVTIDLKSLRQDNFIMRIPPEYQLINVTCSGIASKGTRLPNDQWKIDLWPSDYPQRIKMIFQGRLTSADTKIPLTLSRLNAEKQTILLRFPVLEGVAVQQTLWAISFGTQYNENSLPFDMKLYREGQTDFVALGQHIPVLESKTMQTLLKLNLIRLDNLLLILNSVSVPTSAKSEEVKRWFAHWSNEWFTLANRVESQTANFSQTLPASSTSPVTSSTAASTVTSTPSTTVSTAERLILDPALTTSSTSDSSAVGLIGTILESKNLSAFAEALMQRYQTDVAAKFPTTDQVANRRKPQFLFENSSVFQHDQTTAGVSHFFGVSDAAVGEIRLESNPSDSHFPFFLRNRQLNRLLLWLVVTVFLFILSIRFSFWELFIQFPHFWGIVTGLLLWNLFPFGFLGITILLMTIFSFFYPAWNGCQELTEQTTTQ